MVLHHPGEMPSLLPDPEEEMGSAVAPLSPTVIGTPPMTTIFNLYLFCVSVNISSSNILAVNMKFEN